MKTLLSKALSVASTAHQNQFDKGGIKIRTYKLNWDTASNFMLYNYKGCNMEEQLYYVSSDGKWPCKIHICFEKAQKTGKPFIDVYNKEGLLVKAYVLSCEGYKLLDNCVDHKENQSLQIS